jgi:hypothetical protein
MIYPSQFKFLYQLALPQLAKVKYLALKMDHH